MAVLFSFDLTPAWVRSRERNSLTLFSRDKESRTSLTLLSLTSSLLFVSHYCRVFSRYLSPPVDRLWYYSSCLWKKCFRLRPKYGKLASFGMGWRIFKTVKKWNIEYLKYEVAKCWIISDIQIGYSRSIYSVKYLNYRIFKRLKNQLIFKIMKIRNVRYLKFLKSDISNAQSTKYFKYLAFKGPIIRCIKYLK